MFGGVRIIRKKKVLCVGLKETSKAIENGAILFLFSDKDHQDITKQLMVASRNFACKHVFVLPGHFKRSICEVVGVKRITAFAIDTKVME